eukprot:COSAG01_NODE_4957_length_4590_cov_3.176130_3_plen_219_part_00
MTTAHTHLASAPLGHEGVQVCRGDARALAPAVAPPHLFLDKNRCHIGESQSKRPPQRTQRPPHLSVRRCDHLVSRGVVQHLHAMRGPWQLVVKGTERWRSRAQGATARRVQRPNERLTIGPVDSPRGGCVHSGATVLACHAGQGWFGGRKGAYPSPRTHHVGVVARRVEALACVVAGGSVCSPCETTSVHEMSEHSLQSCSCQACLHARRQTRRCCGR